MNTEAVGVSGNVNRIFNVVSSYLHAASIEEAWTRKICLQVPQKNPTGSNLLNGLMNIYSSIHIAYLLLEYIRNTYACRNTTLPINYCNSNNVDNGKYSHNNRLEDDNNTLVRNYVQSVNCYDNRMALNNRENNEKCKFNNVLNQNGTLTDKLCNMLEIEHMDLFTISASRTLKMNREEREELEFVEETVLNAIDKQLSNMYSRYIYLQIPEDDFQSMTICKASGRSVSFGAILMELNVFPQDMQQEIGEGKIPFGTLLKKYNIDHDVNVERLLSIEIPAEFFSLYKDIDNAHFADKSLSTVKTCGRISKMRVKPGSSNHKYDAVWSFEILNPEYFT